MKELSEPRIVCAALRYPDGVIVCGPRHFDKTMHAQIALMDQGKYRSIHHKATQGFVDQHGVFYTRADAWNVAEKNGQIIGDCGNGEAQRLYSENLY